MKVTIIFTNKTKRQVKSEEGRYFLLKDGTRIRKSSPMISEVLYEEDKKIEKAEEYPQNFLEEVEPEDRELFGNVPAEEKPICFVPIKEEEKKPKKKKASKKSDEKGE